MSITKNRIKEKEFTHVMKVRKVLDVNNTLYKEKKTSNNDETMHVLHVGRPLVYMYTRLVTSPVRNELDVYGVYSLNPGSDGKYTYQYSMVLDKDVVEQIRDFELRII